MEKRAKGVLILSLIVVLGSMFMSGCGVQYNEEENALQSEATTSAENFVEERFRTSPYNYMVTDHQVNSAEFQKMSDDAYVVRIEYHVTFGHSNEDFLTVDVEEFFNMVRDFEDTWIVENRELTEAKVDDSGIELIKSFDQMECIPFLPKEDAGDKNKRNIVDILLREYLNSLLHPKQEKISFGVLNGTSFCKSVELIDVPEGHDEILSCFKIDGGFEGKYIGYTEEFGFSGPLFSEEFLTSDFQELNQKPLYMIEKEDGFYLETAGMFERNYN